MANTDNLSAFPVEHTGGGGHDLASPFLGFFTDSTRTHITAEGALFETSRLLDDEAVALTGCDPDEFTAYELIKDVARQADDMGARYYGGVL